MLKVLHEGDCFSEPCALLLGGFDGFHAGHETLLKEAQKTGLPVGLTAISGGKTGGDIFTFSERETVFERAGFSFVLEIEFTERFKNTSAEEFLAALFEKINAEAVFCGEDFRFGKGALGTPELLKKLAPCTVSVLPLKREGGEKIAASVVKKQLAEGDLEAANEILLGGFFLTGEVERGRGVGHTYGFPTLNLTYPKEKFPLKEGVYGGYAETPAGRFPAIVNFGARPTFDLSERKVEAYLKGFEGDLYGQTVRVYPTGFLRPTCKFESETELEYQLKKDVERV